MVGFFERILSKFDDARNDDKKEEIDGVDVVDPEAVHLSYIGKAAYEVLRTEHSEHHNILWNAALGSVVGNVHQTPNHELFTANVNSIDPREHHSDWLPEKMAEILSRTEKWADILSLAPPDGLFMEEMQKALATVAIRARDNDVVVVVRMIFANIIGMPINCNKLIEKLTINIPQDCTNNINIWIGAWRKGVSWNHAKIIAVDGIYLHTGGHNMWDYHYLKQSPVHDLSIELTGPVAHDGHLYANDQWEFIEGVQSTVMGNLIEKLPDNIRLMVRTRVAVSEFPKGETTEFPPVYQRSITAGLRKKNNRGGGRHRHDDDDDDDDRRHHGQKKSQIPMLTMGRYGAIEKVDRPADDGFIAMFGAARSSIKLALQDLGPVCIPGTKVPLPGCIWPKEYLTALGTAIWERGVDVEIVLSNPGSIPGGLSATEANYGNGWSCVDVAAELIKRIKKQHPDASDEDLCAKVHDNLRVCFLRRSSHHRGKWDTGVSLGLHSKHFIIDNRCAYIGSQNLYICDLAEWGVVIDDKDTVQQLMDEYWNPMWEASYTGDDVDPHEVIDNLDLDRDGKEASNEHERLKYMQHSAMQQTGMGNSTDSHVKHYHKANADIYDNEDDDE